MLTVRPSWPDDRSRAAVRSDSRSSSRCTTAWSSTSVPKVSSAPIERSGSSVTTGRGSWPRASACRWAALASPIARASAGSGMAARSPTVRRPSPARCSVVFSPHPPQRADRQRPQELVHAVGRHHQQPVRLAPGRGQLGQELRRRHPDRAGDALLVGDPSPDPLPDPGRPAEPAPRAGYVQERLVQRTAARPAVSPTGRSPSPRPRPRRSRPSPAAPPPPPGTDRARGASAWRCAPRTCGPRTSADSTTPRRPPPTIIGRPRSSGPPAGSSTLA